MTSAAASACPHCGYRENAPGAVICSSCARPLTEESLNTDSPFEPVSASLNTDSPFEPVSASPYPPAPQPPAPPARKAPQALPEAPAIELILGGKLAGIVTQVERVTGRPPADPARLLTAWAVAVGGAPLLASGLPSLVVVGAVVMAIVVAIGAWRILSARRASSLLCMTMESPTQGQTSVLMVDPTGQPTIDSSVEADGRFLAGRRFYAQRLRVVAAAAPTDASSSALARAGITYIGRKRASLWTPLLILIFWAFFWLTLYGLLHTFLGQVLPR